MKAADDRLDRDLLRRSLRQANWVCVLSPVTLLELLEDLVSARNERAFQARQKPLHIAWQLGGGRVQNYLKFPGNFARESAFRVSEPFGRFTNFDYHQWHKVAVLARSRRQLLSGGVTTTTTVTRSKGLSRDVIKNRLDEGRQVYVDNISKYVIDLKPDYWEARDRGMRNMLTPSEQRAFDASLNGPAVIQGFFDGLRRNLSLNTTPTSKLPSPIEVASSLNAVLTFRKDVLRRTLTTEYKFENDASSYYDMQQLYYLSDPNLVFVTDDRRLRLAVEGSTQASRIMNSFELLRAGST